MLTVQMDARQVRMTTGGVQIHRTYLTVFVRNLSGSTMWNLMKNGLKPSDFSSAELSRKSRNLSSIIRPCSAGVSSMRSIFLSFFNDTATTERLAFGPPDVL